MHAQSHSSLHACRGLTPACMHAGAQDISHIPCHARCSNQATTPSLSNTQQPAISNSPLHCSPVLNANHGTLQQALSPVSLPRKDNAAPLATDHAAPDMLTDYNTAQPTPLTQLAASETAAQGQQLPADLQPLQSKHCTQHAGSSIQCDCHLPYVLFAIDGTWQEAKEIYKVIVCLH